jgi:hypothetical protein
MQKRYECIGGPLCGEKIPVPPGRRSSPAFGTIGSRGESHFYRLCVVKDEMDRVAKFWHYAGTKIDPVAKPRLSPPRRLFRKNC